jgi:hypothetical protein
MERSMLMTGIGGQGIQLAAQVVARAAVLDGREAQRFGSYGGMMRGGNGKVGSQICPIPGSRSTSTRRRSILPRVTATWSTKACRRDVPV